MSKNGSGVLEGPFQLANPSFMKAFSTDWLKKSGSPKGHFFFGNANWIIDC